MIYRFGWVGIGTDSINIEHSLTQRRLDLIFNSKTNHYNAPWTYFTADKQFNNVYKTFPRQKLFGMGTGHPPTRRTAADS
jgi:hypothetical protein